MPEEQSHVAIHLTRLNLVEDEHVRRVCQQRNTEALLNAWFWAAGYEEFDVGDLRYELAEDGQDRRNGFLVFAFIQSVDNDRGRDVGFLERPDNQFIHLVKQGVVGDPRIGLDQRDKERSEIGVLARELDGEGGEDEVEVAPILKIS